MVTRRVDHSAVAWGLLTLFPGSIRQSLLSDPNFRSKYGLAVEAQVAIGDSVSIARSELFNRIRKAFEGTSARPVVKDAAGEEWVVELVENDLIPRVALVRAEIRLPLADFSALSPEPAQRMRGFDQEVANLLPGQDVVRWREILAYRALTDDEMTSFATEIKETPMRLTDAVNVHLQNDGISVSKLVPCSERYFERLVGECGCNQNIADYASSTARQHRREFIQFVWIARGSLAELHTFHRIATRCGLTNQAELDRLSDLIDHTGRLLTLLVRSL